MLGVDDHYLEGMIHGAVATAPHPGYITGLSIPHLPAEYGVLTSADIYGTNSISVHTHEIPLLVEGLVSYTGQPVAVIYGPDPDVTVHLAKRCDVRFSDKPLPSPPLSGVSIHRTKGNPDKAFNSAYQVVESRYSVAPRNIDLSGLRGGVSSAVSYRDETETVVISPSCWPFHVKRSVANVLDISEKNVRVRGALSPATNEMRLWLPAFAASYAALITRYTSSPAKVLAENLIPTSTHTQTFAEVVYRTALGDNGDLAAIDVTVQLDMGAFPFFAEEALERFCLGATGGYSTKHARVSGGITLTDNLPGRLSALDALAYGFAVSEINATRVAEVSQRGVLEWRRSNGVTELPFTSSEKLDVNETLNTLFETTERESDFSRKHASYEMLRKRRYPDTRAAFESEQPEEPADVSDAPSETEEKPEESLPPRDHDLTGTSFPRRGIGFASGFQISGFLHPLNTDMTSVAVKLGSESEVEIISNATMSIHAETALKSLAANIVGVEDSVVSFVGNDTKTAGDNGPSLFSRNITVNRKLIEQCCRAIQKKRFRSPLPLEVKRTTRAVQSAYPNVKHPVSFATAAVEVEIDPITLAPHVRGVWFSIDAGNIVHEGGALRCIETETYQVLRHMLGDSSLDVSMPEVQIAFCGHRRRTSAGVESLPANLLPAAVATAVSQAAGYYFDNVPIAPQSILLTEEAG